MTDYFEKLELEIEHDQKNAKRYQAIPDYIQDMLLPDETSNEWTLHFKHVCKLKRWLSANKRNKLPESFYSKYMQSLGDGWMKKLAELSNGGFDEARANAGFKLMRDHEPKSI